MKTEVECMVAAARLGLTFNGMQEHPDGYSMPMFTDALETRSSFVKRPGETLHEALERVRERFEKKA
jgi:hypothetical protein